MGNSHQMEADATVDESVDSGLARTAVTPVTVGELIGITDNGRVPIVVYPGQFGSAGVEARSIVDLHGAHVGKRVALLFEGADPSRPIVAGVLRDHQGWPLAVGAGQIEVDADGDRLIVSAKTQLVLRCGRASITLTKEGKILIQGAYVSSRASGVNRLKGGSVQIN
jgi:hypothetical protein